MKEIENGLLAYAGRSGSLMEYDSRTHTCRQERLVIAEDDAENRGLQISRMRIEDVLKDPDACKSTGDCVCHEKVYATNLDDLIYCVAQGADTDAAKAFYGRQEALFRGENAYADGTSGKATYAYCREELLGTGEMRA